MKTLLTCALFSCVLFAPGAYAQKAAFPPEAMAAKTVAILNDTKTGTVTDGATEELKQWGHLRVVDDPESAEIVLHFTRQTAHDRSNSQAADANGNPTNNYGFSYSFSSSIQMTATTKDGFAPFYTTTTKDSKQKAGTECVQAFIGAYQDVRAKH